MRESVRLVTAIVIIAAPLLVLLYDLAVFLWFGTESTITGLIREWNTQSHWPEIIYVGAVVALYLHLFRNAF